MGFHYILNPPSYLSEEIIITCPKEQIMHKDFCLDLAVLKTHINSIENIMKPYIKESS